jgi:glycosyltransferase involved in cell wall biosynthesis
VTTDEYEHPSADRAVPSTRAPDGQEGVTAVASTTPSATADAGSAPETAPPLRILHVQHPFVPGLGYQENYLLAKQRRLGHDVLLVTSTVVPPKFQSVVGRARYPPGDYEYDGVPTKRLPPLVTLPGIDDLALRSLARTIERFDPDVVHAHGLLSLKTFQTLRYAAGSDARLFVDVHIDNDNFHLDRPYKRAGFWAFRRFVLPRLVERTDAFLPVNPLSERLLVEDLGVPADRVALLSLGVDDEVFTPDPDAGAAFRAELGVGPDDVLVVSAGNLEPTKDLADLVRAFATVARDRPDVTLVLVGDGEASYLDSVRAVVADEGVEEQVVFYGAVPHHDLQTVYNAADVGVWPGKLGITIIEAIGTGLPVVVCDSPATTFLTGRENGLVFDRHDVPALAARLRQYVDDPALRARHAAAAARLATEELSWTRIAERSIDLYREYGP